MIDKNWFPVRMRSSRLGGPTTLRRTRRLRELLWGRWNRSKVISAHIHRVIEGCIRVFFLKLGEHASHQHTHLLHHSHHLLLKHIFHVHIKPAYILLPLFSVIHIERVGSIVILFITSESVLQYRFANVSIICNFPPLNFNLQISFLWEDHRTASRTNTENLLDFLATHLSVNRTTLIISTANRQYFFWELFRIPAIGMLLLVFFNICFQIAHRFLCRI